MNARKALRQVYKQEYEQVMKEIDCSIFCGYYKVILFRNSKYDMLKKLGIVDKLERKGFICTIDERGYCVVSWNPFDSKINKRSMAKIFNDCFLKISKAILNLMEVTNKDVNKQNNL